MLSNIALEKFHNKIFEKASRFFNDEEMIGFKEGFIVQEEYLQAAFKSIMNTYNGFENYLLAEFGIDEDERNYIKNYCLI